MAFAESLGFIDPHLSAGCSYLTIEAASPRPLPRRIRPLAAQIPGDGCVRDLQTWVHKTHTTALLALDGPLEADSRIRDGQASAVVHEWYADGVGASSLLLGASMTKSTLAHLVGMAACSGALRLDDPVSVHVPELKKSGYADCTVRQVMAMTPGTDWHEDHRDPDGPATRLIGCFLGAGGSSREQLLGLGPEDPPGTSWAYSTADSQLLDWVRERATGVSFPEAAGDLWRRLGCVHDAVVLIDSEGVALAGGGLAATAEDWLRLAALQLTGSAYDEHLLDSWWITESSSPAEWWLAPGMLPSDYTAHAGYGYHWWPLSGDGTRVTADGMRGQFGYVDRRLDVAVVKTSLWPHADPLVDRRMRDLSYLGLPRVAAAAAASSLDPPLEANS